MERILASLTERENRWHIYDRLAARAGSTWHAASCGCSPGSATAGAGRLMPPKA